jgi:hypothetical protein
LISPDAICVAWDTVQHMANHKVNIHRFLFMA